MVIFINQIRMKIGVMFGNPETTTGGNALKFYASVRLDIRRIGAIKDREEVVGNQTRVKVVKNKVAPPFKLVEFDIMYGEGISKTGELIDLGVKAGVVEKSGSWFSYDGQRIGQGRENAKTFLKEHPEVAAARSRRRSRQRRPDRRQDAAGRARRRRGRRCRGRPRGPRRGRARGRQPRRARAASASVPVSELPLRLPHRRRGSRRQKENPIIWPTAKGDAVLGVAALVPAMRRCRLVACSEKRQRR